MPNDDILTRLREAAQVDEYYAITVHRPMLIAIADEIERLRASVINTFDNGFDEIERLRKESEIYKDLYATEIVSRFAGE